MDAQRIFPYPGYRAAPGALGEYNGKFMCNQYVLRVVRAPLPAVIFAAPIATFSSLRNAGNSPEFGSRAIPPEPC